LTSSLKYAEKYASYSSQQAPTIVIAAVIPGNSFPVIEGIYKTDNDGKLVVQRDASGDNVYKKDNFGQNKLDSPKYENNNPQPFVGKACRPGYQSHSVIGVLSSFFFFSCPHPFRFISSLSS